MTLWQLIRVGGFTMYILLFFSILSFAIIIERYLYYRRRSKVKRETFMMGIAKECKKGDVKN